MSRSTCFLLGLASAIGSLSLTFSARADESANALPRYRLQVGQELKYQGDNHFKYENGGYTFKTEWLVGVVGQNSDGSWRLVVRSSQQFITERSGPKAPEAPAQVKLVYCTLFPNGHIPPNDSLNSQTTVSTIFPHLPDNAEEIKNGWKTKGIDGNSYTTYTAARDSDPASDSWSFEGTPHTFMNQIYLSSSHSKYNWDRKRGVIKQVDTENTQDYGIHGKGTGKTELVALEQHDAEWAKHFDEESARYFKVQKIYDELQSKASKDVKETAPLMLQAETSLKDLREKLTVPILQELLDQKIKGHKRVVAYTTESAKHRAAVLGTVAPEWETKDLDGKTHALKGYRGKVVILDFWSRGCGWCVEAMPQVKQLAEEFKNEPVAILGMNTDTDESDAKFVIKVMELNYPSLKAEGLPEKYQVQGFPTLIIVDQAGKVADIHVGYSPTLRDEVAKGIRSLLAKK